MQTVCELNTFRTAAADAGLTEVEIAELISFLGENTTAGDEIPGTGGCRKLRMRRAGMGKRGGYRVITFYSGTMMPVFLITVFAKGEKSNLSQKEKASLKEITAKIVREYKQRVIIAKTGTGQ